MALTSCRGEKRRRFERAQQLRKGEADLTARAIRQWVTGGEEFWPARVSSTAAAERGKEENGVRLGLITARSTRARLPAPA